MKQYAITLLAGLLLAACSSFKAETPQQRAFALQVDYNAVAAALLSYESRPRCPAPHPCSDPSIVDEIRKADNDAFAALQAAQKAITTGDANGPSAYKALTAFEAALTAYRAILINRGLIPGATK